MIAVFAEGLRTARSQPVASFASLLIVAGMCVLVLLTAGRTAGAQEAVLGTLDHAGTRTIVARAEQGAGLDATVLDRLRHVRGIEWAGAFGPAVDGRNSALPDGRLVAVRALWSSDLATEDMAGAAASRLALERLGMQLPAGEIVTTAGERLDVVREYAVPEGAAFLEPAVVVEGGSAQGKVAVLVVVVAEPRYVAPIAAVVRSVLGVSTPGVVQVEASQQMAHLRSVLESQLGESGRGTVLSVFTAAGLLVAAVQFALVLLRRRDFGRRRALGASRDFVAVLVLVQAALLSALGASVGCAAAVIALAATREPLPGAGYVVALGVLATTIGVVASLAPAIVASRREPIVELRVP